jgi:GlcNAc-P-P-Und epimerase
MTLLIGGSGFVGTNIIQLLGKENCYNLDIKPSILYNDITFIHDIREPLDFNKKVDLVILLAAEHKDDVTPVSHYYDVNVNGTKNVLNFMDKYQLKNLIFFSSVAVYGLNINNANEESKTIPFNHYGKSKLKAESEINLWFNKDPINKKINIIRPTVIFGQNNKGNVYNLIKQIVKGKMVQIGNGVNCKSIAYIGNVSSFVKFIIDNSMNGYTIYNYSDKPDYNMNQFITLIKKISNIDYKLIIVPYYLALFIGYIFDFTSFIFNKKFSISSIRIKKFCANTQIDSSKALTFFKPTFTLEEGLENTLKHDFNS